MHMGNDRKNLVDDKEVDREERRGIYRVCFVAFDRVSTSVATKGYSETPNLSLVELVNHFEVEHKIGHFRHWALLACDRNHSRLPMMFGLACLKFHSRRRVRAVVGKVDCSCLVTGLHLWHSMSVRDMLGVEMMRLWAFGHRSLVVAWECWSQW